MTGTMVVTDKPDVARRASRGHIDCDVGILAALDDHEDLHDPNTLQWHPALGRLPAAAQCLLVVLRAVRSERDLSKRHVPLLDMIAHR